MNLCKQAFSLIELLIVMVIIGIVLAIGIPGINQARANAEMETMRTRAVALQSAKLSFIDALGTQNASSSWDHTNPVTTASNKANYTLLLQYLPASFPGNAGNPGDITTLIPQPFGVTLGTTLGTPVRAHDAAGANLPLQKY